MSFDSGAWAIDGALLPSRLARRAEYAATRGSEGIVLKDDLKVTPLATPGVGVTIAAGVGLVLNRYQTTINETYVVSNPNAYEIPSSAMPASNPSAKSYIVAVVIGDAEFSQVGHPWMLATDPPVGEESTFVYVRLTIVEVPAGSKTIPGATYPYLALARLDVPANTTTITSGMIVDLRKLAQPRSDQRMRVSAPGTWTTASPKYIPSGSDYADWGATEFAPTFDVPSWAKRAIISARINGAYILGVASNTGGGVRVQFGTIAAGATSFDLPSSITGGLRMNLECAGEFDCSSVAGTTITARVEGYQSTPATPTTDQKLQLRAGSQMVFDVRFFEE